MSRPADGTVASAAPHRTGVDAVGRFVFRFRDYLAPCGLAVALVVTHPEHPFGSPTVNLGTDVVGVLVACLGQALRVAVIGYAYIVRGGSNRQLAAPQLVCRGFYAHCRNPMYTGNFLLLAGLAIIYNSRWVYALVLPLFYAALLAIVRAEERFLAAKFGGEYDDYCRRVNRFVPHLRGLGATLAPMTFDWRRVLRKEYGTTFAWVSAALFLLIWERLYHFGYPAAATPIPLLAAAYVPLVAAWATVRWLKKTRRLDS